jgi:hypothetical protein
LPELENLEFLRLMLQVALVPGIGNFDLLLELGNLAFNADDVRGVRLFCQFVLRILNHVHDCRMWRISFLPYKSLYWGRYP